MATVFLKGFPFLVAGMLMAFPMEAKQPGTLKQNLTVMIGSESINLTAGQAIQVISQNQGMALIEFTRPDGSIAITQIDVTQINIQPPASPAPAPSVPPADTTPSPQSNPTPASPSPPKTSVTTNPAATADSSTVDPFTQNLSASPAEEKPKAGTPLHAGWQTVKFERLDLPDTKIPSWLKLESLDPARESFMVYLPKGYDPEQTYAIMVWMDQNWKGRLPKDYDSFLDTNNLVFIGAQNSFKFPEESGKDKKKEKKLSIEFYFRAINLALCGENTLAQKVKIDPSKKIIAGYSVGAEAACICVGALPGYYSDMMAWSGVFPLFGANLKKVNEYWESYFQEFNLPYPTENQVNRMRSHTRYVFLAGSLDPSLTVMNDVARAMREDGFHAKAFVQPELGHEVGSLDLTQEALDFLWK